MFTDYFHSPIAVYCLPVLPYEKKDVTTMTSETKLTANRSYANSINIYYSRDFVNLNFLFASLIFYTVFQF
jgi:hypothetical protein